MTTKRGRFGAAATILATTLFAQGIAFAAPDDREQCASAAEQAQQLRDEGKYRRAREQMLICARDVCPGAIKSDCGKWLAEADRDAPTVVFGARDGNGKDVFDVRVSMDGVPILEKLDGKPVLVDSGEHTFKFEAKDGSVKEERVLLRAAEKARPIIATLGGTSTGPTGGPPPGQGGAQPTEKEGSIVPPLVVGGIGLVGIGLFAGFGLAGKSAVDDLQVCKGRCTEAEVDDARTKLIIADISLAVGVVALGVAAYMFFTRSSGGAVKADVKAGAANANPNAIRFDGYRLHF